MATFVIYVDTPTWEMHYDPAHRSYHFVGRCAVRLFVFMDRPFASPVSSFRFSPASPYGDDIVFERARPREERLHRTPLAASAVRDFPEYMPRSPTEFSETDPSETQIPSEGSSPTIPMDYGAGSEDTVTQPLRGGRVRMVPRRGAHARPMQRIATPAEIAQWIGYVPPPFGGQQ